MTDPLLAALIAKLPAPGAAWSHAKRVAWMQMLWLAFDVAYEKDGETTELPAFLAPSSAPAAAAPPAPVKKASVFAFLIDKEGFARRGDGARILPNEAGGAVVYDERGEGDFRTIVWADDSRGIPSGMQLDISPAF